MTYADVEEAIKIEEESAHDWQPEQRLFQKINRILSGHEEFAVANTNAAPHVDGKNVYLPFSNTFKAATSFEEYLLFLKGFDYHELAHQLFSVFKTIPFHIYPDYLELAKLDNRLEDCRVEQLFSSLYPTAGLYFKRNILEFVIKNPNANFVDIYGRRSILPENVNAFFEQNFETDYGAETTAELKHLIDSFMIEPDFDKRIKIADKIYNLLTKNSIRINQSQSPHITKEGSNQDELGEPHKNPRSDKMNKEASSKLKEKLKQQDKKKKEEVKDKDSSKDKSKDSTSKKEQQQQEKQDKEAAQAKDKTATEKAATEKGEQPSEKKVDSSKGGEEGEQSEAAEKEITSSNFKQALKELSEILAESISKDMQGDFETLQHGGGYSPTGAGNPIDAHFRPNDAAIQSKKRLSRIISKLRSGLEQEYRTRLRHGRIDLRETMKAKKTKHFKIFRQFVPDRRHGADLAVACLIDKSGSMSWKIQDALQTFWSINEALIENHSETCCVMFDTAGFLRKDWHGNMRYNTHADGGTDPSNALVIARKKIKDILQLKPHLKPIIIIITDSEYEERTGVTNMIKRAHIKIVEVAIDSRHKQENYDYNISLKSREMEKLPQELGKVLTEITKKAINETAAGWLV